MNHAQVRAIRDAVIVARVRRGESITVVADDYDMTRQRASQIIHAHGLRFEVSRNAVIHGTRSRYRAGCRCSDCRAANQRYHARLKGREAPHHGYSGYSNYGCRCAVCRTAKAEHRRAKPIDT